MSSLIYTIYVDKNVIMVIIDHFVFFLDDRKKYTLRAKGDFVAE